MNKQNTCINHTRVLFVDFTSAFDTMVWSILEKLECVQAPYQLHSRSNYSWLQSLVKAFLVDRQQNAGEGQCVRIGNSKSSTQYPVLNSNLWYRLSTQGCVLLPVWFSIFTNFITSTSDKEKIFRYTDDMTIVGYLNFKNPST